MHTKKLWSVGAGLLLGAAVACDSTLTVEPMNEVEEGQAIVDVGSARAALAGLYDALQSGSYYGGDYNFLGELASDNSDHVGTFTNYADIDQHVTAADNSDIEGMWDAIYDGIGRANTLIAKVGNVTTLDEDERDDMIGQAHFMRALHYHNLVRYWGGVPVRTQPPPNIAELATTARSTVAEVYTQILQDLSQAAQLMSDDDRTRKASLGAVDALRSRVELYRGNWAAAEAAANAVYARGYTLAAEFDDLFTASGNDTPEDIFRTSFTATEFNLVGFYYLSKSFGGRWELAPTTDLRDAFEPGDERLAWSILVDSRRRIYAAKYPTSVGDEDLHVIRFGEVILNKAEALARQNRLGEAVTEYNKLRTRAGVSPHVLGTDVTTQTEVLTAIWEERRKELAFEADRWPDLVRTQRATTILNIPVFRTLFPIPQNEIDVAPRLVQNPGY
ncbi:MAG: RagB/SusD family nutrient uptake outer membrane protein [Gemmatimonadota bacterium]